MFRINSTAMLLISSILLWPLAGCEDIPASKSSQGAVIGGVGGVLAGAALGGHHNRLLGGLLGGALGAGGGYLIGAQMDKNDRRYHDEAIRASDYDRDHPPSETIARTARTADLNGDGFVTLNEVVAMRRAGLSDREMIHRLEDTGQVFFLSREQEDYLRNRGVSREVIRAMRVINQDKEREATPSGQKFESDYRDRTLDRERDRQFDRAVDRDNRESNPYREDYTK